MISTILAAVAALALSAGGAAATPAAVRGVYRLQGTARVAASPSLDRTLDARADATLEPGRGARDLRVRVAAQGYACELVARLDPSGALAFEPAQRCALDLRDDPDARGHVDLTLRSGSGRVERDRLALDLAFALAGVLSLRTAPGGVQVLGVDVPEWTPQVPVRGEARATAEGGRDHSRGAAR